MLRVLKPGVGRIVLELDPVPSRGAYGVLVLSPRIVIPARMQILSAPGIGLLLAAGAGQALVVFLFGVPPLDPAVFSAAAALFAIVGLIACYLPARRATSIDPQSALRYE